MAQKGKRKFKAIISPQVGTEKEKTHNKILCNEDFTFHLSTNKFHNGKL